MSEELRRLRLLSSSLEELGLSSLDDEASLEDEESSLDLERLFELPVPLLVVELLRVLPWELRLPVLLLALLLLELLVLERFWVPSSSLVFLRDRCWVLPLSDDVDRLVSSASSSLTCPP